MVWLPSFLLIFSLEFGLEVVGVMPMFNLGVSAACSISNVAKLLRGMRGKEYYSYFMTAEVKSYVSFIAFGYRVKLKVYVRLATGVSALYFASV